MVSKTVRLNLGSFITMYRNWINLDIIDLSEYARENGYEFKRCDVRNGLPYDDNSVDVIMMMHLLEHLNPIYEGIPLLKECRRVLKVNGILRLIVPLFEKIYDMFLYRDDTSEFEKRQPDVFKSLPRSLKFSYALLGNLSPNYKMEHYEGHQAVYTEDGVLSVIDIAGFPYYLVHNKGETIDKNLMDGMIELDIDHSIIIEAYKEDPKMWGDVNG